MHTSSSTDDVDSTSADGTRSVSWTPMIVIVIAQIMLIFNISTLQVSMDASAGGLRTTATTIGTAIVTYALVVAAMILPGARIAQLIGSRRVFRASVALFGIGMVVMAASLDVTFMIVAQVISGMAAAALVPTLVVPVADNYRGDRQAKALGWLGGAPAMGIVLISLGTSNLVSWGTLPARPDAPFFILDLSPAPLMVLSGVFLLQAFALLAFFPAGALPGYVSDPARRGATSVKDELRSTASSPA